MFFGARFKTRWLLDLELLGWVPAILGAVWVRFTGGFELVFGLFFYAIF